MRVRRTGQDEKQFSGKISRRGESQVFWRVKRRQPSSDDHKRKTIGARSQELCEIICQEWPGGTGQDSFCGSDLTKRVWCMSVRASVRASVRESCRERPSIRNGSGSRKIGNEKFAESTISQHKFQTQPIPNTTSHTMVCREGGSLSLNLPSATRQPCDRE